jgi:Na+/H+-dicarboxylate symporter
MKIWVKLLLGAIVGVVLGYLLPSDNPAISNALVWLDKFAVAIGRYAAIPVLFTSLTLGIYELRQDGKFLGVCVKSIVILIVGGAIVMAIGLFAVYVFSTERIPVMVEKQTQAEAAVTINNLLDLFPSNMLSPLAGDGTYLLPFCTLAFFLALGLTYDRTFAKPVTALLDSLSRVFYHAAAFFTELSGACIIVISAYWAVQFKDLLIGGMFTGIIRLLVVLSIVLCLIVFPVLLYLTKPGSKAKPWWVLLFGALGPGIAGFFSGDISFCLPLFFRHLKENLGIRRRQAAVSTSIFAVFGRAGSAMVAAVAYIIIINSYSSLEISTFSIVTIGLKALLVSLLLFRDTRTGTWSALAILCAWSDQGFASSYLILKPLAFFLIATGVFLDAMFFTFASYIAAVWSGYREDRETKSTV